MKKGFVFAACSIAVFVAASVVGAGVRSRTPQDRTLATEKLRRAPYYPGSRDYRSPGDRHKLLVEAADEDALAAAASRGARQIADYGGFKLLGMDSEAVDAVLESPLSRPDGVGRDTATLRDDFNLLLLRSGAIDTSVEDPSLLTLASSQSSGSRYRLVQFAGPIKDVWFEELRASGFEPVAYIPSNGYLVRSTDPDRSTERLLATSSASGGYLQWTGPFTVDQKIDPSLNGLEGDVTVALQIFRGDRSSRDVSAAKRLATSVVTDAYNVLGFTNMRVRIDGARLRQLAALEDVVNIEPWSAPELHDERSVQIVAGEVTPDYKQSRGPGYLAWLQAHGLGSVFDFVIDAADSGLDRGSTLASNLHPDFLDAAGQSRVVYARDYTSELDAGDAAGHGTLNLSVAAGSRSVTESRDELGYSFGLGVAPGARLGSSKIFRADGLFDLPGSFSSMVAEAYRDGARIVSNSWGSSTGTYTIDSQEYDLRTRDASPAIAGNQEITICFSAGNSGPGRVGSPSSAKNVISVAAGENWRPTGRDGCLVQNEDADNAMDIAFFSSGGPLRDGRMKPDITAPGTHIQGAASQHPDYDGSGVCGPESSTELYFPLGQKLYTWSSGTSHSAPQIAGAAALVRQSLLNQSETPTSALIKALLLNSTTYMTGSLAIGNLPQGRQGWGLVDLGRTFDNASRILVNQSRVLSDSGDEFVLTGEVKDTTRPFRVTLAWTDAPGFSGAAPWINDLDLEVVINGQTYRGNNFLNDVSQPGGAADTKNNVEGVWLPAGTAGPFLVRVRGSAIAGDAVPGNADLTDQDFALVVYNAERRDVGVGVLAAVEVSGGGDAVADPGETVTITTTIRNVSPFQLNGARGSLSTSTAGVTVSGGTADFPNLGPGQTGQNTTSFQVAVDRSVTCGATIQFTMLLTAGQSGSQMTFSVPTGRVDIQSAFSDDIESGESKWAHHSLVKKKKKQVDTWVLTTKRVRSGSNSWFTPNPDSAVNVALDTTPITLPTGRRNLRLIFYHTFQLETLFDGAVLEISDGGDYVDLGPKILKGGYTTKLFTNTDNALQGRDAWTGGRIGAFQEVIVDLDSYAGKTVVIRFHFGSDSSFKELGWYIDDVVVRSERVTCVP